MHSACSVHGPNTCSIRFTRFQFGVACSKFVFTSYRGSLCLGQGTILNSCGSEYAKFSTCTTTRAVTRTAKDHKKPAALQSTPACCPTSAPAREGETCTGEGGTGRHAADRLLHRSLASNGMGSACLWNQEKQQRLAEMPQDPSHSDGHACEVCVCVPHKHLQSRHDQVSASNNAHEVLSQAWLGFTTECCFTQNTGSALP